LQLNVYLLQLKDIGHLMKRLCRVVAVHVMKKY